MDLARRRWNWIGPVLRKPAKRPCTAHREEHANAGGPG